MSRILPNDTCPCGSGLKYKQCCGGIRRLNGNEIFNSFIESMDFMTMSIYSYDKGNISESKRIALELRKNLHDTDKSTSILKHLDKKDIYYFSSVRHDKKGTDVYWTGLCDFGVTVKQYTGEYISGGCTPFLGNIMNDAIKATFNNWWNEIVLINCNNIKYSRADLVKYLANKDNGAHVDDKLTENEYELTRGTGIGMSLNYQGHTIDGTDAIHATVRQIAHEFLYSVSQDEEFKYIKSIVDYVKQWNR